MKKRSGALRGQELHSSTGSHLSPHSGPLTPPQSFHHLSSLTPDGHAPTPSALVPKAAHSWDSEPQSSEKATLHLASQGPGSSTRTLLLSMKTCSARAHRTRPHHPPKSFLQIPKVVESQVCVLHPGLQPQPSAFAGPRAHWERSRQEVGEETAQSQFIICSGHFREA